MVNFYFTKLAKMINYSCMNLKELRKKYKITQKEAASIVGIPYRTYIRYEEEESYISTYKYKKIFLDLENKLRIDESHGILSIDSIRELLIPILKERNINYCYLFGSYAKGNPRENSDIDLLVDTSITGMEFFKLVELLRETLGKKVDLLRLSDLQNDNPIAFEILKDGIRIL